MVTNVSNGLLPMAMPTRKDLRAALAQVVRSVQAQHQLTDEALADVLGVSDGTIRNVRNERTDLNQETIAKLGKRFGPECLDPWSACFGGRNVPKDPTDQRVSLTAITGSLHQLSVATDVESEGGETITHRELAAMLPDLKTTQRLVNSLIARAERLGIAA